MLRWYLLPRHDFSVIGVVSAHFLRRGRDWEIVVLRSSIFSEDRDDPIQMQAQFTRFPGVQPPFPKFVRLAGPAARIFPRICVGRTIPSHLLPIRCKCLAIRRAVKFQPFTISSQKFSEKSNFQEVFLHKCTANFQKLRRRWFDFVVFEGRWQSSPRSCILDVPTQSRFV